MSNDFSDYGNPPFTVLTEYLENAYRVTGPICLPSHVIEPFRSRSSQFDTTSLRTFGRLLDSNRHLNRLRLDAPSFVAIVSIVLQLPHSSTQDRILHAFMKTLSLLKDEATALTAFSSISALQYTTKDVQLFRNQVSKPLVKNALKILTEVGHSIKLKRTATQLLVCVLYEDAYAISLLQTNPALCRIIGFTIHSDADCIFRVLLADLVRALLARGIEDSTFWRNDITAGNTDKFPVNPVGDSTWISRLFDYFAKRGDGVSSAEDRYVAIVTNIETNGQLDLISAFSGSKSLPISGLTLGDTTIQEASSGAILLANTDALTFVLSAATEPCLKLLDLPILGGMRFQHDLEEGSNPAEIYAVSNGQAAVTLVIIYPSDAGYSIHEGGKTAISNCRIICRNECDRNYLEALLMKHIRRLEQGTRPSEVSRPPSSSEIRKADIAFVSSASDQNFEWWPPSSLQSSAVGTVVQDPYVAPDLHQAILQPPLPLLSEVQGGSHIESLHCATELCEIPGDMLDAYSTAGERLLYELVANAEGTTLEAARLEPRHSHSPPLNHRGRSSSCRGSPQNTIGMRFVAEQALFASAETSWSPRSGFPDQFGNKSTPGPPDATERTPKGPRSHRNVLEYPMGRISKPVVSDKLEGALNRLRTRGTAPEARNQGGLKSRPRKTPNVSALEATDWDEIYHQGDTAVKTHTKRPLAKTPTTTGGNGEMNETITQRKIPKVSSEMATADRQKNDTTLEDNSLPATKSRRIRATKSTMYVKNSASGDPQEDEAASDDEEAEIVAPPSRSQMRRVSRQARRRRKGQVKDSQNSNKLAKEKVVLPAGRGLVRPVQQGGSKAYAIQRASQKPGQQFVGQTSKNSNMPTRTSPPVLLNARQTKMATEQHDCGGSVHDYLNEEGAEDSYPRKDSALDEAPEKVSTSFGSKMGQLLGQSGVHDNPNESPNTPFGNASSFIDAVNVAQSASMRKTSPQQAKPRLKVAQSQSTTEKAPDRSRPTRYVDRMHITVDNPTAADRGDASKASSYARSVTQDQNVSVTSPRGHSSAEKGKAPSSGLASNMKGVSQPSEVQEALTYTSRTPAPRVKQPSPTTEAEYLRAYQDTYPSIKSDLIPASDLPVPYTGISQDNTMDAPLGLKSGSHLKHGVAAESAEFQIVEGAPRADYDVQKLPASSPHTAAYVSNVVAKEAGPQDPAKEPALVRTPRRSIRMSAGESTILTDESLHRKAQLVHFGMMGPHNQGIIPERERSATGKVLVQMREKNHKHDGSKDTGVENQHSAKPARLKEVPSKESCAIDASITEDGIGITCDTANEGKSTTTDRQTPQGRNLSQGTRVDENGSPHRQLQSMQPSAPQAETRANTSNGNTEDPLTGTADEEVSYGSDELESDSLPEQDDSEYIEPDTVDLSAVSEFSVGPPRSALALTKLSEPASIPSEHSPRRPCTASKAESAGQDLIAVAVAGPARGRESIGLSARLRVLHPHASDTTNTTALRQPAKAHLSQRSQAMMPPPPVPTSKVRVEMPALKVVVDPRKPIADIESLTSQSSANDIENNPSSAVQVRVKKRSPLPPSESGPSAISPGSFRTNFFNRVHLNSKAMTDGGGVEVHDRSSTSIRYGEADTTLVGHRESVGGSSGRSISGVPPDQSPDSPNSSMSSSPLRINHDKRPATMNDRRLWAENVRRSQKTARDVMIEVADTLLLRLRAEEDVVNRKVHCYSTGGCAVLDEISQKYQSLMEAEDARLHQEVRSLRASVALGLEKIHQGKERKRDTVSLERMRKIIDLRRNGLLASLHDRLQEQREMIAGE